MPVASLGGSRYFVTFTDDYSRWCSVLVIAQKSDVFDCFKKWRVNVEKQTGCLIKALRSDNGGEYVSNIFKAFLEEHGIQQQLTVAYTP